MNKIKGVIFDLDDTLYREIDFVRSGFKAVSEVIEEKYGISKIKFYQKLMRILEKDGRGKVFDTILKNHNIWTKSLVNELVEIYRNHLPNIKLYEDALKTIKLLKKKRVRLGIITDGLAYVQRIKIKALGINNLFNEIIFSDDYGRDRWKPNTFPYKKILELLRLTPNEAIYVGDNPLKDFIGAKKLGILTIRLLRGEYKDLKVSEDYQADYNIDNLLEIIDLINI
jgi:putative hydrolase of the HAD superfamily